MWQSYWNHLSLTNMLNWWSVTVKKTPHSPYTVQPNNIPTHYLQRIFSQHETKRQYFKEKDVWRLQYIIHKRQLTRFKRDSVGTKQEMQHWASSFVQRPIQNIRNSMSMTSSSRLTAIPHLEIMQWLHVTKLFSPKYPILTLSILPKSPFRKDKKKQTNLWSIWS